jgi:predicted metal-dependent phosphoesterase TrpH
VSIDLHTHTTRSDGTTTPSENASLAAHAGLRGLAVTDHDTTAGWEEAADACRRLGLAFVPGVELSTEVHGTSVHLLGYWMDPDHPDLVAECDRLFNERERRAAAIVARLADLGAPLDLERVRAHARDAPIGRPHIAKAMVEAGIVPDVASAFDHYIADGGPAYVPKHALDPVAGARLIRRAGGVAVLAHPALTGERDLPAPEAPAATARMLELLDDLVAAGLAGVEAHHVGHDEEQRAVWREAARERELLVTASSDFHGDTKDVALGAASSPLELLDELRSRVGGGGPAEQGTGAPTSAGIGGTVSANSSMSKEAQRW